MELDGSRLQADLRGILTGDVHFAPIFQQLYASDASIHEIQPLGVVRPRSVNDVSELLKYCSEREIPVFPRGGGSGLAGQSLGRGIIVDFSRYLRRIHAPQQNYVRVQSGVVQADLNRHLQRFGMLFGPDPVTRSVSAIGSMIAVDAAGSHSPRYGSTGDSVQSLQVVLSNGEVLELAQHEWIAEQAAPTRQGELAQQVGLMLQQNAALIMRPPWGEVARGCGYRIEKVLDGDRVNLARLIAGSEGTLGLITEATLRLEPIPHVRGLMLLFFARLEQAAKAAVELQKEQLSACDLMDRRLLEIARESEQVYAAIVPRGAEAMLLVEMQGDDPAWVRSQLTRILQGMQHGGRPIVSHRLTTDPIERGMLWRLARRVIPRLYRLKGNLRPLPLLDDILIPPRRLPEFLVEVQNIFKTERVTSTLFAHALHGHVDVRPFFDLADKQHQLRLSRLCEALYAKVFEFEGVVCGQHAMGLSRAAWAEKQLGPRLELFRRLRQLFDPHGILNPGKFLSPTPPKVTEHLRPVPSHHYQSPAIEAGKELSPLGNSLDAAEALLGSEQHVAEQLSPADMAKLPWEDRLPVVDGDHMAIERVELPVLLHWNQQESLAYTSRSCNGCGRCRTSAASERMCPMFRVHKGEEASPRAKANLMRGILTGTLDAELLESEELKNISDLCFNCHQCRTECPANVNIPKLVQEAKAQHVASHGLTLKDRMINRTDLISAIGSRFPRTANWAIGSPLMRWLLEKTFGVAQARKLPKVARKTFLSWAAREKLNRPDRASGRKVLFFVDQYANWHNPLLGRALVEVMRHQNVNVYVPTSQSPSFMAMISSGDVQRARKHIKNNIKILAEGVRMGYDIVTLEPTAALCFQQEYRYLQDSEDTQLIAENCYEASAYLWAMHQRNELELDLRPVNLSIIYHEPCHARALYPHQPALRLMQLIPGLQIDQADAGCSGMAGTFGLQRKNFRTSIRVGWNLISRMRETTAQLGSTECVACKMQMELATSKPTVHPVALLAYSYGSMPQLAAWFTSRNDGMRVN
ncbi:MAG: anaerobic glycerol-3-phosphate dehydrogenase subunit C [Pirellulaceae bacterium]|nr:anaerobic glycerol-3-phosphate dehydrogenase subunit C [Pirellulaceae bacterium]